MPPYPSQFLVEISPINEKRIYTKDGFIFQSGSTPSSQPVWSAMLSPHRSRILINLPMEGAPANILNKTDFASIYFPNWGAVKSQAMNNPVKPSAQNLPREGYTVYVSGADERGLSKMLAIAQNLRARFPRLHVSVRPHPQYNHAKMIVRSIGQAVGFNNFQKAKVCGDKLFIFITCAVSAETAQILTSILSIYNNISVAVQRENFMPTKELKTIVMHRLARK